MARHNGLKKGDKVRIRTDLKEGERYYNVSNGARDVVTEIMRKMAGKIVTITGKTFQDKYHIDGDNGRYVWTESMFENDGKTVKQEVVTEKVGKYNHIAIEVDRVIYSDPATIVFYRELGSKVIKKAVAKCSPLDEYDRQKGYEAAVLKAHMKSIQRQLSKF